MKTRTKLVSNSSSCSFCLYGWYGSCKEAINLTKATGIFEKEKQEHIDKYCNGEEDPSVLEWEYIGENFYGGNSDFEDCVYLGHEWKEIKDDETGLQFKKRTENWVKEMLGEKASKQCGTHEDAWYNG